MKTFVLAFLLLLFFGCQNADSGQMAMPETVMDQTEAAEAPPADGDFQMKNEEAPPAPPQALPAEQKTSTPRHIIKNADCRMQVADVDASTARAIEYSTSIGGYMSQLETVNTNWETSNRLTLRIPVEAFDNFLTTVGKEALFVDHRRVGTEDVSAEFIDLQARLKTRKEVKARYEEILRQKTKTVEDVLNAEEKIRHLQEEIESAEGRLKYLSDRSAMSTVNLDFYEKKEYEQHPVAYSESFWVKLREGVVNGWHSLTSVLIFFVNVWPFTLLVLGLWFGRRRIFRRFRKA